MTYATQADLTARFGEDELIQLTDRSGAGTVDASVVNAALADADALINGYLAGRYGVPVSPVPALLTRIACDLARHQLHGKATTDSVTAAQEQALRMLRDLASGTAVLTGAAPPAAGASPASSPGLVRMATPDRATDRASLADYLG